MGTGELDLLIGSRVQHSTRECAASCGLKLEHARIIYIVSISLHPETGQDYTARSGQLKKKKERKKRGTCNWRTKNVTLGAARIIDSAAPRRADRESQLPFIVRSIKCKIAFTLVRL